MVSLVYFGEDLSNEIGDSLPCFCYEPSPRWTMQQDLMAMLAAGETVTIRPATFAEFLQAESLVALAKIEGGVCEQMAAVANPGTVQ